jgi:antitoxin (DNA-binding transcriptional repressor) of toxin-antitoxin stability system
MKHVTVEEARESLSDLVEAAVGGEEVVLLGEHRRPAVRLVPVGEGMTAPKPQFGSARGMITMADDFDAPLADFDFYTE